tara:strand:- start:4997 stop:5287 length:291 start_codon:yes stop_codon:yes gene_type:complete
MKKIIKHFLLLFFLLPPYFKPRFKESDFISSKYPNEYGEENKWLFYKFLRILLAIGQFIFLFNLIPFLGGINPFFFILFPYLILLMIRWNQYWGID